MSFINRLSKNNFEMPKFSFFNTSEFSVINWLIAFYFFCNTHNTFLGLWQLTGIWALFFGFLWCCGLVKTLYSDKILFILMFSLTLRMLTEHFLLPLGFDFLVFMILIITTFSKIRPTHISINHELPK